VRERALRTAAEAELAQTMVWYRAHEATWHRKAEEWGKAAMIKLKRSTAELKDVKAQLEASRLEVERSHRSIQAVELSRKHDYEALKSAGEQEGIFGIKRLESLRSKTKRDRHGTGLRMLSRVAGSLGFGSKAGGEKWTSLTRDATNQGTPEFLQTFFHNRSEVKSCVDQWYVGAQQILVSSRRMRTGMIILRMHCSAETELAAARGLVAWRQKSMKPDWKAKAKLDSVNHAHYLEQEKFCLEKEKLEVEARMAEARNARNIMHNVAQKILHRDKACAIVIWQENLRSHMGVKRGERIMKRVGARFMNKDTVHVLMEMKENFQLHLRKMHAAHVMKKVGSRMNKRALYQNWFEWYKNAKDGFKEMWQLRAEKYQLEIDSLQLKYALTSQIGAETVMKRVARRMLSKVALGGLNVWRVQVEAHLEQLKGRRLMQRVAMRIMNKSLSLVFRDMKENWIVVRDNARGKGILKRVGARMLRADWRGGLERWHQRALRAGLMAAYDAPNPNPNPNPTCRSHGRL